MPTVIDLLEREARAGLRWYAGSEIGDRYAKLLSHAVGPDAAAVSLSDRTLGDLVDPTRPTRMLHLVNAVSADIGTDAAGWTVDRLLAYAAELEQRERARSDTDLS